MASPGNISYVWGQTQLKPTSDVTEAPLNVETTAGVANQQPLYILSEIILYLQTTLQGHMYAVRKHR
jgi:hypothetical protein